LVTCAFNLLRSGLRPQLVSFCLVQIGNHKQLVNNHELTDIERSPVTVTTPHGATITGVALRIRLSPKTLKFEQMDASESKLAAQAFGLDVKNTAELKHAYNANLKLLPSDEVLVKTTKGKIEWHPLRSVAIDTAKSHERCCRSLCLCDPKDPLIDFLGSFYHLGCIRCHICCKTQEELKQVNVDVTEGMDGLTCSECTSKTSTHEAARGMWEGAHKEKKTAPSQKKKSVGRGRLKAKERTKLRNYSSNQFVSEKSALKIIANLAGNKLERVRKEEVAKHANEIRAKEEAAEIAAVAATAASANNANTTSPTAWTELNKSLKQTLKGLVVLTTHKSRNALGEAAERQQKNQEDQRGRTGKNKKSKTSKKGTTGTMSSGKGDGGNQFKKRRK